MNDRASTCSQCGGHIYRNRSVGVRPGQAVMPPDTPPGPTPLAQRQDSVTDQLHDLRRLAVAHGMYDAAEWLERSTT